MRGLELIESQTVLCSGRFLNNSCIFCILSVSEKRLDGRILIWAPDPRKEVSNLLATGALTVKVIIF